LSIDEVNPIDLAILRLETLTFRAQQYIDQNIVDVGIREILDPMKRLASSRGLAQSYIDSFEIKKMGFMKIGFVINAAGLTVTGISINKLLEFGWREHDITFNPIGHWTGGKYGPGDHFAALVHHPGFQGYHMLVTMQNWGFVEVFAFKLIEQTSKYLEATSFR